MWSDYPACAFRRRAAVEPVIGHLKSDYRLLRNYLKGVEGDMINTIMAAVCIFRTKLTPYSGEIDPPFRGN